MHFLNGDVFSKVLEYRKAMRSTPKNVVKTWAKNTPHILHFVNSLIRNHISSKQDLVDIWKTNRNCKLSQLYICFIALNIYNLLLVLLEEFSDFLVNVSVAEVAMKWPPTD